MSIPLQFAILYEGQVFVWSDCLLDLGTDFLVGNMVFVWDAWYLAVALCILVWSSAVRVHDSRAYGGQIETLHVSRTVSPASKCLPSLLIQLHFYYFLFRHEEVCVTNSDSDTYVVLDHFWKAQDLVFLFFFLRNCDGVLMKLNLPGRVWLVRLICVWFTSLRFSSSCSPPGSLHGWRGIKYQVKFFAIAAPEASNTRRFQITSHGPEV